MCHLVGEACLAFLSLQSEFGLVGPLSDHDMCGAIQSPLGAGMR